MSPTKKQTSKPKRAWKVAVLAALQSFPGPVTLQLLYAKVRALAPELVADNPKHADAKIRQVVQRLARAGLAKHVRKGVWQAARR